MTDSNDVLAARRRLTDAMHAMHADQRIVVSEERARELEAAWAAYDAAIRASVKP